MTWNGSAGGNYWYADTPSGGGSSTLSGLTDIGIDSPQQYQVLMYDGSGSWNNVALQLGSTQFTNIIGTPSGGQVLSWNAGGYWESTTISGGGGGSSTLSGLTDTSISQLASGEYLRWSGSVWENYPVTTYPTITSLTDTTIGSPTGGQVLTWNSSSSVWKPQVTLLAELGDVSGTPTDGQFLSWNSGASSWKPIDYNCLLYTSPSPRD